MAEVIHTVGQAARHGNASILQELLNEGNTVDNPDNRGWRPTHEAAYGNYVECLKMLLENDNTDVDWEDYEGKTALYIAAMEGHYDSVRILLEHGANGNISTNMDSTPLMAAVKARALSTVNCLLLHGANTNLEDFSETTALHQAASKRGTADIVKSLLLHGAAIDAKEQYNITPVFTAAQCGNFDCLIIMIDYMKEHDQLEVLNIPARDGAQPTLLAAQNGHLDCLDLLLKNGAECNRMCKAPAILPLHAALHFGHFECAKRLYPLTDQSLFSSCDQSVFDMVLDNENQEGLEILIELGIDVKMHHTLVINSWGGSSEFEPRMLRFTENQLEFSSSVSPLTCVALNKYPIESAEILIQHGAELNVCHQLELVPLIAALDRKYSELVILLLSRGADVNYYNKTIQGNLVVFVSVFWYKGLKLLLQHGAEVDSLFNKSFMKQCNESFWKKYNCDSSMKDLNDPMVSLCDMFMGGRILLDQYGLTVYQVLCLLLDYSTSVSLDDNLHQYVNSEEEWNTLKGITESPRSLGQLCRVTLLRHIPSHILNKPDLVRESLPLPPTVVSFLLHNDGS